VRSNLTVSWCRRYPRNRLILATHMRVFAFPCVSSAYTDGFYRALRASGQEVVEGIFAGGWLWSHVRRGDVAHFHWPSFQYVTRNGKFGQIKGFVRFLVLLVLLRLLGARIVWTAHNLMPHDPCVFRWMDVLARHIVIAFSEKIYVHGATPATMLATRFLKARRKMVIIPHGHFINFYPDSVSRDSARAHFDLAPSTFVYLFIGLCKPYKNLDGLVQAFCRISSDIALLVAGKFQDRAYEAMVRAMSAADARVRIDARFIPDDELQLFLRACDAVVVPYREILTSGSAVLAMSFGRPVVTIDRGFLHDVVVEGSGILYNPDDTGGLAHALKAVTQQKWNETFIHAHISQFRFEDAAQIFLAALKSV
jgi:beta-1,4-mannosyltransferase